MRDLKKTSYSVVVLCVVTLQMGCSRAPPAYTSHYTPAPTPPTPSYPPAPPIVLPPNAKAVFIGDSWTEGYTAIPETQGYAYLTEQAMGWTGPILGADGTGYTAGHDGVPDYADRITTLPANISDAQIVIIQGSGNDTAKAEAPGVPTIADHTITAAKTKFPAAAIVIFGASPITAPGTSLDGTLDKKLGAAAARASVNYISCVKHHWINPSNVDELIDPATKHPSTQGHVYLSQRLTAELQNLIQAQ
jgi:hypothetical protein